MCVSVCVGEGGGVMNLFLPFKQKENQNTKTKSIQFTVLIDKQKKADMNKHPVKHKEGCKNEKHCISI